MDEIQVMTVIQLKSAGDALVKKMVHAVYRIPLKLAGIWFRCNLKMVYLVIDSCLMISDVLQSAFPSKFSKEKNEPEATVNQEEIVRGVKKFRRCLFVNIDKSYQQKFKAHNEEAIRRLDELRNAVGNREEFQAAKNRIEEMNKSFREEREALFKGVEELDIDEIIEAIKEDQCEKNEIEEAKHKQISNLSRERAALAMDVCYRQLNDNRKNITSRKKNGVSKNRLNATNIKLVEQILRVSSNLIGELNKLNHQVGHLSEMSKRMADMQYELGAGRKLLSEVEADRNEMKRKLLTLERLIKEEEKYLDEFSYESGFEENEVPVSL